MFVICRKCLSVAGRGAAQFVEVYAMLVDMETTFVAMAQFQDSP